MISQKPRFAQGGALDIACNVCAKRRLLRNEPGAALRACEARAAQRRACHSPSISRPEETKDARAGLLTIRVMRQLDGRRSSVPNRVG